MRTLVERIPVSSSNVQSIGYDPASKTLEVEFNDGAIYQYHGVPQDTYDGFLRASSKGSYLHANIKNQYSYTKL